MFVQGKLRSEIRKRFLVHYEQKFLKDTVFLGVFEFKQMIPIFITQELEYLGNGKIV